MIALLLKDMRSRFGTSYISYLITIAWPLSHAAVISIGYTLRTQIAPVGDSPLMFVTTGVVPYVLCLYPARLMGRALLGNRQLLNIPVVKPIHIILARCILEVLNALVVLMIILFTLHLLEMDIVPSDVVEAEQAIFATIFLGIALGVLNVVLVAIIGQFFLIFFQVSMVGMYITSGVFLPVHLMPEKMQKYVVYNPLFNLVEWLRSAYYLGYMSESYYKENVIGVALIALTLGLLGERFLRGRLYA